MGCCAEAGECFQDVCAGNGNPDLCVGLGKEFHGSWLGSLSPPPSPFSVSFTESGQAELQDQGLLEAKEIISLFVRYIVGGAVLTKELWGLFCIS